MQTLAYSYCRYSSLVQKKGRSLERQQEKFIKICNDYGLTPSNEVFYDLGKSGFPKGKTSPALIKSEQQKELKRFAQLSKENKIPAGSWLVLDEISRLGRWDSYDIEGFIRFLVMDCKLIVFIDNLKCDANNVTEAGVKLQIVLKAMLAWEEAKKRQEFSIRSWTKKRANAATKPMTARCPLWLIPQYDVAGKLSWFKVDEAKAQVIRYIFSLAGLSGKGTLSICQQLNHDKVKTFSGRGLWWNGHVLRILKDRRAIGEFKGIEGYFPAVVTKAEFDLANAARIKRWATKGRSDQIANLFTGLAWDVETKTKMVLDCKSATLKKWVPQAHYLGKSAKGKTFSYLEFESQFLRVVENLTLKEGTATTYATEKQVLEAEKTVLESRREALGKALEDASEATIAFTVKSLDKINSEIEEVKKKLDKINGESVSASPIEALGMAKSISEQLKQAEGQDLADLRLRLREVIRGLVERIDCKIERNGLLNTLEATIIFKSGVTRKLFIETRNGKRIFTIAEDTEGLLQFAEVDRKYYPEFTSQFEQVNKLKKELGFSVEEQ